MELSLRAYARHRGMSEGAVRAAIKKGRITKNENGKIDPVIADQQWATNSDPAQSNSTVSDVSDDKRHSSSSVQTSYQQSRAIHEAYNAQMAKLQFEKEKGILIPREQANAELFTSARTTRDRILNIPNHLAPLLVGKTDIRAIKTILIDAITSALSELADAHGSQAQ